MENRDRLRAISYEFYSRGHYPRLEDIHWMLEILTVIIDREDLDHLTPEELEAARVNLRLSEKNPAGRRGSKRKRG